MLNVRYAQKILEKNFGINPARLLILSKNTFQAGQIKITFINDNTLIFSINNVSINLTF